jgi:hypothetical protein
MADYEQAGARNPDGIKVGGAATDKVGFYGATPVVRQATAAAATDAATVITLANALKTACDNLGITA